MLWSQWKSSCIELKIDHTRRKLKNTQSLQQDTLCSRPASSVWIPLENKTTTKLSPSKNVVHFSVLPCELLKEEFLLLSEASYGYLIVKIKSKNWPEEDIAGVVHEISHIFRGKCESQGQFTVWQNKYIIPELQSFAFPVLLCNRTMLISNDYILTNCGL